MTSDPGPPTPPPFPPSQPGPFQPVPSGRFQPDPGSPSGQFQPAPTASKARPVVVVLALLVVLALGGAGTMTALWNDARGDRETAARSVEDATRRVTDARDKLAETRGSIDTAAATVTSLEAENAALHKCADPAKDSIIAARDGDKPALAAAVDRVEANCR